MARKRRSGRWEKRVLLCPNCNCENDVWICERSRRIKCNAKGCKESLTVPSKQGYLKEHQPPASARVTSRDSYDNGRRYWAFVAYRHTDNSEDGRQWATWLHQALETYEVPVDLRGTSNERGEEIPERIFPVFLDEQELATGDLTERISSALDQTRVLVVLCSPRTLESKHVYEEIRYFKRNINAKAIHAAVIDGDPGADTVEEGLCLPAPLRYDLGPDGQPDPVQARLPLVADFRLPNGKQGWTSASGYRLSLKDAEDVPSRQIDRLVADYQLHLENAKLQLIAGILGVSFGTLKARDKQYQLDLAKVRARNLRRWLFIVCALALLATFAAVGAFWQRNIAQTQAAISESRRLSTLSSDELRKGRIDAALLLAVEAYKTSKTHDAQFSLLSALGRGQHLQTYLYRDDNWVTCLCWSRDGKLITSGTEKGGIVIWDVEQNKLRTKLSGHAGVVTGIVVSPDSKTIASCGEDGVINLWDAAAGAISVPRSLKAGMGCVHSISYSPDGLTIASGGVNGAVILWDLGTGMPTRSAPLQGLSDAVKCLSFSPDSKWLAAGDWNGSIALWDTQSIKAIEPLYKAHDSFVARLAFNPDGSRLVSCSNDKTLKLWTLSNGVLKHEYEKSGKYPIISAEFSPDGTTVASGDHGAIVTLWDVASGEQRESMPLEGHEGRVSGLAFSPDGKTLASASWDKTIILWDLANRWSLAKPHHAHEGTVMSLAITSDGKTLASGNNTGVIRLWDIEDGIRERCSLEGHKGAVTCLAFNADGSGLVSGGGHLFGNESPDGVLTRTPVPGELLWWDLHTGNHFAFPLGHRDQVSCLCFSRTGDILATGGLDKTVILWDAHSRHPRSTFPDVHKDSVSSLAAGPGADGIASACSSEVAIKIYNARTGSEFLSLTPSHQTGVLSIAFSPDGATLASGGWRGPIVLTDMASQKDLRPDLLGHSNVVKDICYGDNGRILASASGDGTVMLWDVRARRSIGPPFTAHRENIELVSGEIHASLRSADCVVFGRENTRLYSGGGDGSIVVYDLDPESWLARARRIANRNLTQSEWDRFFGPDIEYRPTFPSFEKSP